MSVPIEMKLLEDFIKCDDVFPKNYLSFQFFQNFSL